MLNSTMNNQAQQQKQSTSNLQCPCQTLKFSINCNCHTSSDTLPQKYSFSVPLSSNFLHDKEPSIWKSTQVKTDDVLEALLSHNSNLTKYLSSYRTKETQAETSKQQNVVNQEEYEHRPNTGNIINDYKLKILSIPQNKPIKEKQIAIASPKNEKIYTSFQQQTSPQYKKSPKKAHQQPHTNNDKINSYITNKLAKQSRYLSDTGFRKYFQRQCFQNYGRNSNDIIDQNRLKTFNINPHSGCNMPMKEETSHHALLAGNTERYEKQKGELEHNRKLYENKKQERVNTDLIQAGTLIEQSNKYHKEQQKYKHIKLVPGKNTLSHQQQQQMKRREQQEQYQLEMQERRKMMKIKQEEQHRRAKEYQEFLRSREREKREGEREDEREGKRYRRDEERQQQILQQQQRKSKQQQKIDKANRQKELNQRRILNKQIPQQLQPKKQAKQPQKSKPIQNRNPSITLTPQQKQCFLYKKDQIIQNCFNNQNIATIIQNFQQHYQNPCQQCKDRQYTHCCCMSG